MRDCYVESGVPSQSSRESTEGLLHDVHGLCGGTAISDDPQDGKRGF